MARMKAGLWAAVVLVLISSVAVYAGISLLQRGDLVTIDKARTVNAFIIQYCRDNQVLPSLEVLKRNYPDLNPTTGWFFFTNDKTWLKVQYPMRWWNKEAIGQRQISEFTATVYAYTMEYKCSNTK